MQDLPSITIKLHLEKITTKIVDNKCRIIIKKLWLERSFLSFTGYVPYLLWLLFASYLNISISVLN